MKDFVIFLDRCYKKKEKMEIEIMDDDYKNDKKKKNVKIRMVHKNKRELSQEMKRQNKENFHK